MGDKTGRAARWLIACSAFVIGGVGAALFVLGKDGETLTRENLEAAEKLWNEGGFRSYDVSIRMHGVQHNEHFVEVRDGKIVKMATGGVEAPERSWRHWSVPGMFGILRQELENAGAQNPYSVDDPSKILLTVDFHPEFGYPRRYLRHVLERDLGTEWEMTLTPR